MNNLKNRVQLIGFLGMDPEIKEFDNGKVLARMSLATSESYHNKSGERVTDTHWHRVIAWGSTAQLVGNLLKKGAEVVVNGKLAQNVYEDKDGVKRYNTDIICSEFLLLNRDQQPE